MIRAMPMLLAVVVGAWVGVAAVGWLGLQALAHLAAALGALNAGYSAWAQRIDERLGQLDRLTLDDRRLQVRLTDRVGARRERLAAKRVAVFIAGVAAMVAAGVFSVSTDETLRAASVIVSMGGAMAGATGCALLYVESMRVDARVAELQRYTDRLKAAAEEAGRMKRAKP
jgi:uncharacterized membrane protein YfcA